MIRKVAITCVVGAGERPRGRSRLHFRKPRKPNPIDARPQLALALRHHPPPANRQYFR
jgi:hypothetical protein